MKIGLVLDDSLDRPDGVQQYILTLGKWLEAQGNVVHYLVGETHRKDIPNVHSLGRTLRVRFNGNIVGTPLPVSKRKIQSLLEKLELDVVHVQLPYSPVLAGRLISATSPQQAVIGTLHIFPNTITENALNKLLTLVNKSTLDRFDEVIAVSSVAASASHLQNRSSLAVIPNPVDIHKFKLSNTKNTKPHKIVFLGRLVPRKGCMVLLKAISQLKNQGKLGQDWVIEVGGSGTLLPNLKAYVSKNGLTKIVAFKGFIDENEKPSFLSSADIAVFPSSGGESFGIVLIEAMAAQAMVLAGNNPGYAGVMGAKSAELFSTKNSTELASLLANASSSEAFRNSVIAMQSELVKQYDIELIGRRILAIYKKALRSRRKMG